jgi:hypothetical protein
MLKYAAPPADSKSSGINPLLHSAGAIFSCGLIQRVCEKAGGRYPPPTLCSQVYENKGRRTYEKVKNVKRKGLLADFAQECDSVWDRWLGEEATSISHKDITQTLPNVDIYFTGNHDQ